MITFEKSRRRAAGAGRRPAELRGLPNPAQGSAYYRPGATRSDELLGNPDLAGNPGVERLRAYDTATRPAVPMSGTGASLVRTMPQGPAQDMLRRTGRLYPQVDALGNQAPPQDFRANVPDAAAAGAAMREKERAGGLAAQWATPESDVEHGWDPDLAREVLAGTARRRAAMQQGAVATPARTPAAATPAATPAAPGEPTPEQVAAYRAKVYGTPGEVPGTGEGAGWRSGRGETRAEYLQRGDMPAGAAGAQGPAGTAAEPTRRTGGWESLSPTVPGPGNTTFQLQPTATPPGGIPFQITPSAPEQTVLDELAAADPYAHANFNRPVGAAGSPGVPGPAGAPGTPGASLVRGPTAPAAAQIPLGGMTLPGEGGYAGPTVTQINPATQRPYTAQEAGGMNQQFFNSPGMRRQAALNEGIAAGRRDIGMLQGANRRAAALGLQPYRSPAEMQTEQAGAQIAGAAARGATAEAAGAEAQARQQGAFSDAFGAYIKTLTPQQFGQAMSQRDPQENIDRLTALLPSLAGNPEAQQMVNQAIQDASMGGHFVKNPGWWGTLWNAVNGHVAWPPNATNLVPAAPRPGG